jgi:hypothetical protein
MFPIPADPLDEAAPCGAVGVRAQRVRAEPVQHPLPALGVQHLAGGGAGEVGEAAGAGDPQPHRLPRHDPPPVDGALALLLPLADAQARGADRVGVDESGIAREGPGPVQAQVHVDVPHRGVRRVDLGRRGEGQEEVLARRLGAEQHLAVEPSGVGEASLGAGGAHPLPAEPPREGGGEPMDGMALRHQRASAPAPWSSL